MPIDKKIEKIKNDYHIDDQKHWINKELVGIIQYRQQKKWQVSLIIMIIFMVVLLLMIYFIGEGRDLMPEWKEILLLMLGGFIASFSKVVDFWFNNQENDNKLLEHADD